MSAKVQRVRLIGGTRGGEDWDVYAYQPTIYLPKRISAAEEAELRIDDSMSWKRPDEVYARRVDGAFQYRKTVFYQPRTQPSPSCASRKILGRYGSKDGP